MKLAEQLIGFVNAAFTGLWIETHEPDEAERDITQLARQQKWRIAVWDVANGLRVPGSSGSGTETGGDPLAARRALPALAEKDGSALLVLHNFHRFLGSLEVVQTTFTQPIADNVSLSDRDVRQLALAPPERLAACQVLVVGVGAIGRQVAWQLAALGVPRLILVDPDDVRVENLAPQGYLPEDLGKWKVQATAQLCQRVHPPIDVETRALPRRWPHVGTLPEPSLANDEFVPDELHAVQCQRSGDHKAGQAPGRPLMGREPEHLREHLRGLWPP